MQRLILIAMGLVLCTLIVLGAAKVRANTLHGRFERITLGMSSNELERILGTPWLDPELRRRRFGNQVEHGSSMEEDSSSLGIWVYASGTILIECDAEGRMVEKKIGPPFQDHDSLTRRLLAQLGF